MQSVVSADDLKKIAATYETAMARAGVHKEDARAAVDTAQKKGIHPAAFKLGVKLKALARSKPNKVRAFLKSLDDMVQGLDLDAQLDLEDAIKEAGGAAVSLVANAVRVVREDPDLARKLANSSVTDSNGDGFKVDADGVVTSAKEQSAKERPRARGRRRSKEAYTRGLHS